MEGNIMTSIVAIWTEMVTWLTTTIGSIGAVFYADGNLTLIGTLAVVALALGVAFKLFHVVKNFVTLRG